MSKFTQSKRSAKPKVSTASLPDIIFMLLFFFMVTTVLRDATLKLEVQTPTATELTKLTRKSLVSYIYVGVPKYPYNQELGDSPRIQLGDKFASVADIPLYLTRAIESVPERDRSQFNTSLRIDEDVTMGIVQDIKTELRKFGQLKINYSASPRVE